MPRFALALLLATLAKVSAWTPTLRPAVTPSRAHVVAVDQFRWSKAKAGEKVDLVADPATKDITWMKKAWDDAADKMSADEVKRLVLPSNAAFRSLATPRDAMPISAHAPHYCVCAVLRDQR